MKEDPLSATPAGDEKTLGSPYGPHPRGVDQSAGGADSSPHETDPSDDVRLDGMTANPAQDPKRTQATRDDRAP